MAKDKLTQTFTKGYNGDASDFVLDSSQVSAVKNMLFERGLLYSRPGLTEVASTTGVPYVWGAWSKIWGVRGQNSLVQYATSLGGAFKLRTLNLVAGGATPLLQESGDLTGTALAAGSWDGAMSYDAVAMDPNSVVYAALGTGQFVKVTTGYTILSGGSIPGGGLFNSIVAQGTRLLAAQTLSNAILWSKINDATTWQNDFTTGFALLENADQINGLGVVRNTIVLLRQNSITLGVVTGNGSNPFDWKTFGAGGRGAPHPAGCVSYDDLMYYVGQGDVHTYDLTGIQNIGEGIVTELFGYLRQYNVYPHAFVTRTYKNGYRQQLHIIPTYAPVQGAPISYAGIPILPHFVYDITEQKWSRHVYDTFASDPYMYSGFELNYLQEPATANSGVQQCTPCLLRRSSPSFKYSYWDYTQPCESAMSFTTGRLTLGDPTTENKLVRMMVVAYLGTAGPCNCTATFDSFLGNTDNTAAKTFTLNTGWNRVWVNNIAVGQFFKVKVDIPASNQVVFRQLVFDYETSGQEVRV